MLQHNLSCIPNVTAYNSAIAESAGTMTLHVDRMNAGNYSLATQAIPAGHAAESVDVSVLGTASEFARILDEIDGPFIYKSDAQGYDQKIAALIPDEFWKATRMASFELWRLPENDYDQDAFARALSWFNNLTLGSQFGRTVSPSEVIAYLQGEDMKSDDLFAWK